MKEKNITISDIAKTAGVSTATVSRVLNSPDLVEENTRKMVNDVISKMHYTPSAAARNLSLKSTSTIGVIVPEINNTFFGDLFAGIEDVINKNNYTLLYSSNDDNKDKDYRALDMMKMQRVCGLLYVPAVKYKQLGYFEQLQRKLNRLDCPVVCMDRNIGLECDSVAFDDRQALKKAVTSLTSEGYRKIAIIIGEEDNILSYQRYLGYTDGLKEAGIDLEEGLIFRGEYKLATGYRLTKLMMEQENQPDAVITCNNSLTKGYLKAVYEKGSSEVDHYEHIALDSIEMMNILGIPYNYIERDSYELGRRAAELLIDRIQGKAKEYRDIVLNAPLIHNTF